MNRVVPCDRCKKIGGVKPRKDTMKIAFQDGKNGENWEKWGNLEKNLPNFHPFPPQ